MAIIKATHHGCGDVDILASEVIVTVGHAASWNKYEFVCPICQKQVVRPTDSSVVRQLRVVGAIIVRADAPAEYVQGRRLGAACPPLTPDVIRDFGLLLERLGPDALIAAVEAA